jgi:hypothetical protein
MESGRRDVGGLERIESEQVINAQETRNALAKQFIRLAKLGDPTPSVMNVERLEFRNTAPLTVTNFDEGQNGQRLEILGDGNTTIQNNARIVCASGADTLLDAGSTYSFTRYTDGVWHQSAGGSGGGGGGGGAGVTTFAGRSGAVIPVAGDYPPAFIGAVPSSHLTDADPHPQYELDANKGVASGYASLDGTGKVPLAQLPAITVSPVARAYFMVVIDRLQSFSDTARIGELQFRTVAGGTDFASGATPIFTEQFASSGDNSAAAAFDGNSATAWASATTNRPVGLGAQMAAAHVINEVKITARNDGFGPTAAPIMGRFMSSANGIDWVLEWAFITPATWTAGLTRTFTRPA